jgi:hypothetical protein
MADLNSQRVRHSGSGNLNPKSSRPIEKNEIILSRWLPDRLLHADLGLFYGMILIERKRSIRVELY